MHPNMRRLLGLDTPVVFHQPTWPTPVHIPYTAPVEDKKS